MAYQLLFQYLCFLKWSQLKIMHTIIIDPSENQGTSNAMSTDAQYEEGKSISRKECVILLIAQKRQSRGNSEQHCFLRCYLSFFRLFADINCNKL